jgi:2-dehydropantoate 2-reductase
MWLQFVGFACNATIASLTRSRAGIIARAAASSAFVDAVIDECTRVSTAEGYPPPAQGAQIIQGMFAQPDSTYGPSLLIDMEDGRPAEGEHTIGDLVRRAARHGVSAPLLTAALCNLQAYDIKRAQQATQ